METVRRLARAADTSDCGVFIRRPAAKLREARVRLSSESADHPESIRGVYFAGQTAANGVKVAFLFPGQGSQYVDMLREHTIYFEELRQTFEFADHVLEDRIPERLSWYVFPPPQFTPDEQGAARNALTQTQIAEPALGAAELGVLEILDALGIRPAVVGGHSYDEYVALCAAGVLGKEALLSLSETRGRLIAEHTAAEPGTMAAVDAQSRLRQFEQFGVAEAGGVALAFAHVGPLLLGAILGAML
jgi:acyl transferase domain-containing protein